MMMVSPFIRINQFAIVDPYDVILYCGFGGHLKGSLVLSFKPWITYIPNGLSIDGSLYLVGCTGITELPNDLTVGGNLYLFGSGIGEDDFKKPKGVVVTGTIFFD